MTQPSYCLGFIYDQMGTRVWLQQKQRTWQAGKLNGIGGKILTPMEEDIVDPETPINAMHREFNEEVETGLGHKKLFWRSGPILRFRNGAIVHTFFVHVSDTFFERLEAKTDEEMVWYRIEGMPPYRLLVPHVVWLVQYGAAVLADDNLQNIVM